MDQENISAFADGELPLDQVNAVLAVLHDSDDVAGRTTWDVYHQIGDILRSDELDITMKPDFQARMAARLAAEPSIVAPVAIDMSSIKLSSSNQFNRRITWPGMAVAAAVLALVMTPQLMVSFKNDLPNATLASANRAETPIITAQPVRTAASISNVVGNSSVESVANNPQSPGDVILRDPRIDEYLIAHQRYSPSVYSAAQYVRSATFVKNAEK